MEVTESNIGKGIRNLPNDILHMILFYLSNKDIDNFLLTGKTVYQKIGDIFWINKAIKEFGITIQDINKYKKENTYRSYYRKIHSTLNSVTIDFLLTESVHKNRTDLVKGCIKYGANIHIESNWPLRSSSYNGRSEIVDVLLKNGANISAINDWPLRYACVQGHTETICILLAHIDKNIPNYIPSEKLLARLRKSETLQPDAVCLIRDFLSI